MSLPASRACLPAAPALPLAARLPVCWPARPPCPRPVSDTAQVWAAQGGGGGGTACLGTDTLLCCAVQRAPARNFITSLLTLCSSGRLKVVMVEDRMFYGGLRKGFSLERGVEARVAKPMTPGDVDMRDWLMVGAPMMLTGVSVGSVSSLSGLVWSGLVWSGLVWSTADSQ